MADGKVVISTELDNSRLPKGIAQTKGELGGLGSVVKKLGGVIAAAFSVKVITDFAKECLDLGSDLQEVQNVVDVTFITMNEQVNEFARNAAQTAGLSETMAKRYAGTFGAMAKSFKFTEAEAYQMSTALTQLSGDVASFYNLSQDEAYTKLKSVFTGETESLKDLGVVMTQTALDSYAMANGFGKTTSQMSEQEKVALRYRFVMDQLAGASDDFLRTSDSWANQTRLLTLQFEQLKATLGQGLINVLTPVVKLLNTMLGQLQGVAEAFQSFTDSVFGDASSAEKAAKSYNAAAEGAESIADNTDKAGKAAKKHLASFDELNVIGKDTDEADGGGTAGGTISIPTIDITAGENAQDNASPAIEAAVNKIMELIDPLRDIDFGPVGDSFSNLGGSMQNFASLVLDELEWAWFNILVPLAEWTIEEGAPGAIDLLSDSLDECVDLLGDFSDLLSGEINFGEFVGGLSETQSALVAIAAALVSIKVASAGVTIFSGLRELVTTGAIAKLGEVFAIAASGAGTLSEAINLVFGPSSIIAGVAAVIGGIVLAGVNFFQMFQEGFSWLKEALMVIGIALAAVGAIILGAPVAIAAVVASIVAAVATAVVLVKEHWNEICAWFSDLCASIGAFFADLWDGIVSGLLSAVNSVIGFINNLILAAVSGLNSIIGMLNKLSFDVPDWVPVIGGETFGFNIPKIKAPQIPYLAQGTVIPPNKEFMAVLGDQRHGTNIEAPLSTIQEAVANVMYDYINSNMAGHEATVAVLRDILEAILGIEIGDEVIASAYKRYQNKMAIATGGSV